jgi:hypothetical protein
VTVLPSDFTICGNLVGKDILNVFKWECYLDGSTVKFRIKEFNPNKGLKDLINFTTSKWRPIQFKAYDGNTVVYQTALTDPITTPAGHWWGNTIQNIDLLDNLQLGVSISSNTVANVSYLNSSGGSIIGNTGYLQSLDLSADGMIYVHSTDLDIPSIHIGGKNVSLVSLDSKKIKSNNNSTSTCNSNTGEVDNPDTNVLICIGGTAGQKHAWIEVNAEGPSNSYDVTVFMKEPSFARVHNSQLTKGGTALTIDNATKPNLITSTETSDNKADGVKLYQSSKVVVNSLWSFKNEGNGLTLVGLVGSKDNRIFGSTLSFNKGRGAYFQDTTTVNNILHDSMIANNCTTSASSAFGAIEYNEAKSNTAYNLVVTANECHGLKIWNPSSANSKASTNTFLNLTITKNDDGIMVDNSDKNVFANIIASNTTFISSSAAGLKLQSSHTNRFTNFVTTNNNTGVSFIDSSNNDFTNALLTGSNSPNCYMNLNSSNNTLSASSCSTGVTPDITKQLKDLKNAFVGKVASDQKNKNNDDYSNNPNSYLFPTSITDFINFSNPFRYWANNTLVFPYDSPFDNLYNARYCDDDSTNPDGCAIWDWRLKTSDSDIKNRTGDGQNTNTTFTSGTCIDELKGNQKISDYQAIPNTFLFRAFEIAFDGPGDDDGLCESNEKCIYSPHFGAYQGEGNPMTTSCIPPIPSGAGAANDLTGYTIYAYPTNGGL